MKTRLKTAGILILALLVLVWLDFYLLNFLIFAAVLALSLSEALKLYKIDDETIIPLGIGLFIIFAIFSGNSFSHVYKFIALILLVASSFLAYKNSENLNSLKVLIYPLAPIFIMFSIYQVLGITCLVYLLVIIACADSGAYFIGKAFGSHGFCQTSPNKTLEGLLGGVVCAVFVGGAYYAFFMDAGTLPNPLISTIFIVVAGIFGDLFESYLKRKAGVKDSGEIFPGHGGMLDRIDSYLFGAIAMSLIYIW